jgi:NitT/TauT family transport system substrate-binding protein
MNRRHFLSLAPAALAVSGSAVVSSGLTGCKAKVDPNVLRFGHFPNITHVQGLVAHQLSRQGKGWFEEKLGVKVEWFTYNAGPSATEAIFSGSLDVTYIGPSPVLNAYAKSKGTEMRVLAGGANGGNALVVRPAANINTPADFKGKKIASPQLGNTQDIQLRAYLAENGLNITQTGGDAMILPTLNPDQLSLFQKGDLDAVWTVEPWVTRLELEAGGKIFLEDKDTNVTLLAGSAALVKDRPELAKKLQTAHAELTAWIKANDAEAKKLISAELEALMGKAPGEELLNKALARTVITDTVSRESMDKMVASAQKVGFLKDIPSLDQLFPKL